MVLWIVSVLYLWSIKSSRLFTLMPIAKDTIFNNINDGVLVLDEAKQLVEYNNAFSLMFPGLNKSMLGLNFWEMWYRLTEEDFPYEFGLSSIVRELPIGEREKRRIYQVRISPLQFLTETKGNIVIFKDITERKELQFQLERQAFYDELTQIYNRRAFF